MFGMRMEYNPKGLYLSLVGGALVFVVALVCLDSYHLLKNQVTVVATHAAVIVVWGLAVCYFSRPHRRPRRSRPH